MIDGNMIALSRYEREIEQYDSENEARIEFIEWVIGELEDIKEGIEDEEINDKLIGLIGKLEGER